MSRRKPGPVHYAALDQQYGGYVPACGVEALPGRTTPDVSCVTCRKCLQWLKSTTTKNPMMPNPSPIDLAIWGLWGYKMFANPAPRYDDLRGMTVPQATSILGADHIEWLKTQPASVVEGYKVGAWTANNLESLVAYETLFPKTGAKLASNPECGPGRRKPKGAVAPTCSHPGCGRTMTWIPWNGWQCRNWLFHTTGKVSNPSPSTSCPVCGGQGGYLGQLGKLHYFRCIQCGMEFSKGTPCRHKAKKNPLSIVEYRSRVRREVEAAVRSGQMTEREGRRMIGEILSKIPKR
jgi:hypothetical protein